MKHKILRTIYEVGNLYEHKLCAKFDMQLDKFPELEELIIDGFIERFDKKEGFGIQGLRLTQKGRDELNRLNNLPKEILPLSQEQIRFGELRSKLKDNSITFEEMKEIFRVYFRL